MKSPTSVEQKAYAVLRIVAGFLFACHGAQKLLGAPGGHPAHAPLYVAAGIIELGGGGLVALGLQTRVAAFLASGEMAVAYFLAHARLALFPIANGGEPAVLYCFIFLLIAARGGVAWAVDALPASARPVRRERRTVKHDVGKPDMVKRDYG